MKIQDFVISGLDTGNSAFRCSEADVDYENCAVLGYCSANSGNSLPTFNPVDGTDMLS
jgi:hypothetical protein